MKTIPVCLISIATGIYLASIGHDITTREFWIISGLMAAYGVSCMVYILS